MKGVVSVSQQTFWKTTLKIIKNMAFVSLTMIIQEFFYVLGFLIFQTLTSIKCILNLIFPYPCVMLIGLYFLLTCIMSNLSYIFLVKISIFIVNIFKHALGECGIYMVLSLLLFMCYIPSLKTF